MGVTIPCHNIWNDKSRWSGGSTRHPTHYNMTGRQCSARIHHCENLSAGRVSNRTGQGCDSCQTRTTATHLWLVGGWLVYELSSHQHDHYIPVLTALMSLPLKLPVSMSAFAIEFGVWRSHAFKSPFLFLSRGRIYHSKQSKCRNCCSYVFIYFYIM